MHLHVLGFVILVTLPSATQTTKESKNLSTESRSLCHPAKNWGLISKGERVGPGQLWLPHHCCELNLHIYSQHSDLLSAVHSVCAKELTTTKIYKGSNLNGHQLRTD